METLSLSYGPNLQSKQYTVIFLVELVTMFYTGLKSITNLNTVGRMRHRHSSDGLNAFKVFSASQFSSREIVLHNVSKLQYDKPFKHLEVKNNHKGTV